MSEGVAGRHTADYGAQQLHQLQHYQPEFFFKALTKHETIDIKAVASFSCLLKKLFET
jgi:hypothetical protein